MSDDSNLQSKLPVRSMGLKLIIVCALALLMYIPALFVYLLVMDRTERAKQAESGISDLVGGEQTFLGPIIAVPYTVPSNDADGHLETHYYYISPVTGATNISVKTEVRHRSLFKVPVYQADILFTADFDLTDSPNNAPANAVFDWSRAAAFIGASDPRGALDDATISIGDKKVLLVPGGQDQTFQINQHDGTSTNLHVFATALGNLVQPGAKLQIKAAARFSGAGRIAVLPYGRTSTLSMSGDWPNPSFDGGFLPVKRTITSSGFQAEWSVPLIARGVQSEGTASMITALGPASLGVSFVELVDPYQSVTRSLKYALLFLGLVFLAYFIFEVTTGKRVHPAQYILIGLAQIIFYLLLLSLAERVGFDFGFLIAAAATVGLISSYAGWVFGRREQTIQAWVSFSLLYALIYILMRLEDEALLVGAVTSFAAIAAVMYITRNLDWYSTFGGTPTKPK